MVETSTSEKLLLYYFNETGMADSVLIQHSIDTDPLVEMEFENIKATADYLDRISMNPSAKTLESIMSYAAITAPLYHK